MKHAKKLFAVLLAVLMVASMAGCGSGGSGSGSGSNGSAEGSDGAAIKLGGIGPLTGPAAIYGNAAKNGTEIAVEEINAMGGIQFELSYQDDEHDAEKLSLIHISEPTRH